MVQAQKIACVNDAAFVMSFEAVCPDGRSDSTGNYSISLTREIDLAQLPFKEGTEFWPEVHAVLGKTESAPDHVVFARNGQTATYLVRGITLGYSISLTS